MKYRFWKDNRTDKDFILSESEVQDKFLEWMKSKDRDWLDYYGHNQSMMHLFIGESENGKGLESVSDDITDNHLWDTLKLTRNKYFKSLSI